jgi:hypothetical protein
MPSKAELWSRAGRTVVFPRPHGCAVSGEATFCLFDFPGHLGKPFLRGLQGFPDGLKRSTGKAFLQLLDLIFRQILKPHHAVLGVFIRADEFVQLQLNCRGVAVLGVLDQEHHEESDDRGAGVDDELPGIGVAESRAGDRPGRDYDDGPDERVSAPALLRGPLRRSREAI